MAHVRMKIYGGGSKSIFKPGNYDNINLSSHTVYYTYADKWGNPALSSSNYTLSTNANYCQITSPDLIGGSARVETGAGYAYDIVLNKSFVAKKQIEFDISGYLSWSGRYPNGSGSITIGVANSAITSGWDFPGGNKKVTLDSFSYPGKYFTRNINRGIYILNLSSPETFNRIRVRVSQWAASGENVSYGGPERSTYFRLYNIICK